MLIRQMRAEEFDERIALSEFAFQIKLSPERLESERKHYRPENEWGAFDDRGRLLSKLTILPFEAWIHGRKLAMGGIAGVATWPDARRQGCVDKLLVKSLETMRANGQTLSMLAPFSFSFYRKYGWEMTVERKNYSFETRQLPRRKETPGKVERMPKPDVGVLDEAYAKVASRYSGTLARSADWWERKVLSKPGLVAVYRNEDGEAEGYVYYEVMGRKMTVHDWASATEAATAALWTYVANHDSMVERVETVAPIDDALPFLLDDPRIKQEVIPYFMSRIVDAEAFVASVSFAAGDREDEVTLALTDAHAPWNEGTFKLAIGQDGTATLERASESVANASCDIQTWTALLLGNRSAAWLARVGRLGGEAWAIDALERRIPRRTTHLMDFF